MNQSTINKIDRGSFAQEDPAALLEHFFSDQTVPEDAKTRIRADLAAGTSPQNVLSKIKSTQNLRPIRDEDPIDIPLEQEHAQMWGTAKAAGKAGVNFAADAGLMLVPEAKAVANPVVGPILKKIFTTITDPSARAAIQYSMLHGPIAYALGKIGMRQDEGVVGTALQEAINMTLMGGGNAAGRGVQNLTKLAGGGVIPQAINRGVTEGGVNAAATSALGGSGSDQILGAIGGGAGGILGGAGKYYTDSWQSQMAPIKASLAKLGIDAPPEIFDNQSILMSFLDDPVQNPRIKGVIAKGLLDLSNKAHGVMTPPGAPPVTGVANSPENLAYVDYMRPEMEKSRSMIINQPSLEAEVAMRSQPANPDVFAKGIADQQAMAEAQGGAAKERAMNASRLAEEDFASRKGYAKQTRDSENQLIADRQKSYETQAEAQAAQELSAEQARQQGEYQKGVTQDLPGILVPEAAGQSLDALVAGSNAAPGIIKGMVSGMNKRQVKDAGRVYDDMRTTVETQGGRDIAVEPAFLQQALDSNAHRMDEAPVINTSPGFNAFITKIFALANDAGQPIPFKDLPSAITYYKAFNGAIRNMPFEKAGNSKAILVNMKEQLREYIRNKAQQAGRQDLADAFDNANATYEHAFTGQAALKKTVPEAFPKNRMVETEGKMGKKLSGETSDLVQTVSNVLTPAAGAAFNLAARSKALGGVIEMIQSGKTKPEALKNAIRAIKNIPQPEQLAAIAAIDAWSEQNPATLKSIEGNRQAALAGADALATSERGTLDQGYDTAQNALGIRRQSRLDSIKGTLDTEQGQAAEKTALWKTPLKLNPVHGKMSEVGANAQMISKAKEMHRQAPADVKTGIEMQLVQEIVDRSKGEQGEFDPSTFAYNLLTLERQGLDFLDPALTKSLKGISKIDTALLDSTTKVQKSLSKGSSVDVLKDMIEHPQNIRTGDYSKVFSYLRSAPTAWPKFMKYLSDAILNKDSNGYISSEAPGVWDALPTDLKNRFAPGQKLLIDAMMDLADGLSKNSHRAGVTRPPPAATYLRKVGSQGSFLSTILGFPKVLGLLTAIKFPEKAVTALLNNETGVTGQSIRNLTTLARQMKGWLLPEEEDNGK